MTLFQLFLSVTLLPAFAMTLHTPSAQNDLQDIETLIRAYAKAGDQQMVADIQAVTHESFRVVFRLSDEQTIILPREAYLSKIESKEFGGDKRTVEVQQIDLRAGKTAVAKVVMRGEQATMSNYLNLTKVNGEWLLMSDLAFMGE